MIAFRRPLIVVGTLLFSSALIVPAATANEIEEFYKDRTVSWRVGSSAGGNYALYARRLADAMSKYIPGNPKILPTFSARGGGRTEAAYVSNVGPRDGSMLGMTQQNVPIFFVLNPVGMKFDVSKWQWIGNAAKIGSVMAVMRSTGATSLKSLRKKRVIIGATGPTSETFMNPTLANYFLGTRFKIVTGYRGSGPLFKALMGGETSAVAISYVTFQTRFNSLVTENKIAFPFQVGLDAHPDLANVPVMWTLGKTKLDREAMKLVASSDRFGRSLWFPEGVPKARLQAFRDAFDKAVRDPVYIAQIKKALHPVNPVSGLEVEAAARELFATPQNVVNHTRKALNIKIRK